MVGIDSVEVERRLLAGELVCPCGGDLALWGMPGLRADESAVSDCADVHFGRGPFGKLHVRCGKAAHTSGPRP
jgi:integrase/recombinase XerD